MTQPAATPVSDRAFDAALAPALDGDAATALDQLVQLPAEGLGKWQRETLDCLRRRFRPEATAPAPHLADSPAADDATRLAESTRSAFRTHWTQLLSGQVTPEDADDALATTLSRVAASGLSDRASGGDRQARADALTSTLASQLRAAGYGVLDGITPPLREWIVWRTGDERHSVEQVELPDGDIAVRLTRVTEPLSRGWVEWASCGRHATRGWVARDGSIVVVDSDRHVSEHARIGEAWRVDLLAHEAQHVFDLRRWPRLADADLEYRAKLVEIVLTPDAERFARVEAIAAQARPDPRSPHALASWHVAAALRDWRETAGVGHPDAAALRDTALAALRGHARDLDSTAAETADPHSGRRVLTALLPAR